MKNIKQYPGTFLAACGVVVALLTVQARGQALGKESGPYLTVGAGANFMSKEYDADPGVRLSAALGYNFNRWVGLEFETGFLYNSFKSSASTSSDYAGQVPFLVNVVLRYENESKWVPYVGMGLGVDICFDQNGGGGDAVYQPMVGVRRMLNERMSVGVGYKYLGFFVQSALRDTQQGNHAVMLDVNWKF